MRIDEAELVGHEGMTGQLKRTLVAASEDRNAWIPRYEQLVLIASDADWDWGQLNTILYREPSILEPLLFKLHFRRRHPYSNEAKTRILRFLATAYHISRDVRYFNEFLWFYDRRKEHRPLWLLTLDSFFNNLGHNNVHFFPLARTGEMESFIHATLARMRTWQNHDVDPAMRIGLLGSPTFFPSVRRELMDQGFTVKNYFIPHHPNRAINMALRNKFAFLALRAAKRSLFKYQRIDLDYRDPEIERVLLNDNLDIGFHKLGFIIRRNVIDGFKLGLLNDHWGLLPFVRGRSTLEYSVLLGVPLAATVHVVTEGVDTGDIVALFPYQELTSRGKSLRQIKKAVRRERDARAVESIRLLSKTRSAIMENRPVQGRTFYSMHPRLTRFIDHRILAQAS